MAAAAGERDRGETPRMTFEEFCDTYYDRVVGFAVHAFGGADAHDVAHEALSRAMVAYESLDHERDAWPWLATVVRNTGRDALRRRPTLPIEEAESVAEPDGAFDAAAADEERRTLHRALRRVPASDRDVLLMRVRDELPFAEIAARTGRSSGALRVQVVRARQRLAQEFVRLGGTAYGVGVVVSVRAGRARERAAGVVAALPSAAQLATAAVVCGGVASGVAGGASATVSQPATPVVVREVAEARPADAVAAAPVRRTAERATAPVRAATWNGGPGAAEAATVSGVPVAQPHSRRVELHGPGRKVRLGANAGQDGAAVLPRCAVPAVC